jgi:hypothetical protein
MTLQLLHSEFPLYEEILFSFLSVWGGILIRHYALIQDFFHKVNPFHLRIARNSSGSKLKQVYCDTHNKYSIKTCHSGTIFCGYFLPHRYPRL